MLDDWSQGDIKDIVMFAKNDSKVVAMAFHAELQLNSQLCIKGHVSFDEDKSKDDVKRWFKLAMRRWREFLFSCMITGGSASEYFVFNTMRDAYVSKVPRFSYGYVICDHVSVEELLKENEDWFVSEEQRLSQGVFERDELKEE